MPLAAAHGAQYLAIAPQPRPVTEYLPHNRKPRDDPYCSVQIWKLDKDAGLVCEMVICLDVEPLLEIKWVPPEVWPASVSVASGGELCRGVVLMSISGDVRHPAVCYQACQPMVSSTCSPYPNSASPGRGKAKPHIVCLWKSRSGPCPLMQSSRKCTSSQTSPCRLKRRVPGASPGRLGADLPQDCSAVGPALRAVVMP